MTEACISQLPITVRKHQRQLTYEEKRFIWPILWDLQSTIRRPYCFGSLARGPNMTGSCGAKPLISNAKKEGESVGYSPQSTWGHVFQDFRDFPSILYSKQFMDLKPSSTTSTVGGHDVILSPTDYRFSLQTFIDGLHSFTSLSMAQYISKLQIWFSINFFFAICYGCLLD